MRLQISPWTEAQQRQNTNASVNRTEHRQVPLIATAINFLDIEARGSAGKDQSCEHVILVLCIRCSLSAWNKLIIPCCKHVNMSGKDTCSQRNAMNWLKNKQSESEMDMNDTCINTAIFHDIPQNCGNPNCKGRRAVQCTSSPNINQAVWKNRWFHRFPMRYECRREQRLAKEILKIRNSFSKRMIVNYYILSFSLNSWLWLLFFWEKEKKWLDAFKRFCRNHCAIKLVPVIIGLEKRPEFVTIGKPVVGHVERCQLNFMCMKTEKMSPHCLFTFCSYAQKSKEFEPQLGWWI